MTRSDPYPVRLYFPVIDEDIANNGTAIEGIGERMVVIESFEFAVQVHYIKAGLLHILVILTGESACRCLYICEAKRGRVPAVANGCIALEGAVEDAGKLAGVAPASVGRIDQNPIVDVAVKSIVTNGDAQAACYRLRRIHGGVVEGWIERATEPEKGVVVAEIVTFDRRLERIRDISHILRIVTIVDHLKRLKPERVGSKVQCHEARHSEYRRASVVCILCRAIAQECHARRMDHTSPGGPDAHVVIR